MRAELMVCLLIFLLLLIKLGRGMRNESLLLVVHVLLALTVVLCFAGTTGGKLFGGMFNSSPLLAFQKGVLSLGVLLLSMLNYDWLKNHAHLPEFFMLLLSAVLGMFFMISSGNLLMFYLSLELATIPVAALSNFDLDKRIASEAAMKMILSSAFSSGILLFGISILYGVTGTISFSEIAQQLHGSPLEITAFLLIFTAFAFKLSVVPFHLWTADVYEGSPVAVSAFLSVISKGAITFILITTLYRAFQPLAGAWQLALMLLAVLTIIIGNLFALRQQNLKRFLAFSSIAQVGFILVGVSSNTVSGAASAVYFVLIYVFTNLAAFGVVSIVSSATGMESISSYRGFYRNNKFLVWMFALALFSLAGIPPTAGFFGKFFLIGAGASGGNYLFITIVAINLMVSLYYYLKVAIALFSEPEAAPPAKVNASRTARLGLAICAAGILATGFVGWVYEYIKSVSG